MNALITGLLGGVAIIIGLAITMTKQDTAERMQGASKWTLVPESMFIPGATGCGGIAIAIVGVVIVVIALVMGLT